MTLIITFTNTPEKNERPKIFPSPFSAIPHTIARQAAAQLQTWITGQTDWQHDFNSVNGGKMFGVLVLKNSDDQLGFVAAFSGMLAGQWQLPGFVPPIFDQSERQMFLPAGEAELGRYTSQIETLNNSAARHGLFLRLKQLSQQRCIDMQTLKKTHMMRKAQRRDQRDACQFVRVEEKKELLEKLSFESQQDKREFKQVKASWQARQTVFQQQLDKIESQISVLKKTRGKLSNSLQQQVFATYILANKRGEKKTISQFFEDDRPPSGTGDCAAPKLIHYACKHQLTPLALAEFWWGAAPKQEVRHHGHYYPACRGKCQPILPFMLKGYDVQPAPILGDRFYNHHAPATIFEDEDLLVVNKPSGLLSVPGKEVKDSVLTRLQQRYPEATGPLLVHRLDMSTSGLLLAAKNAATHKALQHQFERRSIEKRYVAILSKRLVEHQDKGIVDLPLRVDLDDRPRQRVCFSYGKAAQTHWQVISRQQSTTRVYFYPVTGRTHQLRLHAAHQDGLNAAIAGDELYGVAAERLLLHAERLRFTQPNTGKRIEIKRAAPF